MQLLTKYLLATTAALTMSAASACSIPTFSASQQFWDSSAGKAPFKNKNYNAMCAALAKANAGIQVYANATVLSNTSITWVMVSIASKDGAFVVPDFSSSRTVANSSSASMDMALNNIEDAVNQALDGWNYEAAIRAYSKTSAKFAGSSK